MIIYTDFIPKRFGGVTYGLLTLIRPKYRNSKGLHAHEAVHRKQFYRNPLMGLWYFFSGKSRLYYEVEAYTAQLRVDPDKLDVFARFLSTNYKLDITTGEAAKLLMDSLELANQAEGQHAG